jgi:hypothetical protein
MLAVLKKWLRPAEPEREGFAGLEAWAKARGCSFRGVRRSEGFVLEGSLAAKAWRIEWGPSQRPYVSGFELRIRTEMGLPGGLHGLVLTRRVQEAMEKDVFDQYVEDVKTRVDTRTPPEMRWLVMYPRFTNSELKSLRDNWAAVSNFKPWMESWLGGALSIELRGMAGDGAIPIVLMATRGRIVLRTALSEPDPATIERWLALFETAMCEAQRAATDFSDAAAPSTQPSMWEASALQTKTAGAH